VAATTLGSNLSSDPGVLYVAGGWWLVAIVLGLWLGRRAAVSESIRHLLAGARHQMTLPEQNPVRTLLNRLWPLLLSAIVAVAVAVALPQVPGVAAGFAILWGLAWRHQASAVTAIEERDGARFYVDPTPPLAAIKLVRTPGFRANLAEQGSTAPVGRG
jgi:hypothetical protein